MISFSYKENVRKHLNWSYLEDLTGVFISYEMTTTVRFCISYDLSKWFLLPLSGHYFSDNGRRHYVTSSHKNVMSRVALFMTCRYPLNNSDVI